MMNIISTKKGNTSNIKNFFTHNPINRRREEGLNLILKEQQINESIVSQVETHNNSMDSLTLKSVTNIDNAIFSIGNSFSLKNINYSQQTENNFFEIKLQMIFSGKESKKNLNKRDMIQKDVCRTFQKTPYFCEQPTQELLETILFDLTKDIEVGYVQGMNYIAAAVIFHCGNYNKSFEVCNFLFHKLEMNSIYSYTGLEKHINIFKEILFTYCNKVFNFCEDVLKLDYLLYFLDLYFCLFFNKIPLEFSHILLENYCKSGWYFFYKLVLAFFKHFKRKYLGKKTKTRMDKLSRLDLTLLFKNFYKEKEFNWKRVVKKALSLKIDEDIVDRNIEWKFSGMFN